MDKTLIFVEDGSVDVEELKGNLDRDTLVVTYRQGANAPEIQQPEKPIIDSIGKIMSYAHGKDGEVYIYDEKGNDVPLAEYVAKHCAYKEDMEVTAEYILSGDLCMGCEMCTAGILNIVAIQAVTLYDLLKKRNNAIPPVKIGDIILIKNKMGSGELLPWRVDRIEIYDKGYALLCGREGKENNYTTVTSNYLNKTWFIK